MLLLIIALAAGAAVFFAIKMRSANAAKQAPPVYPTMAPRQVQEWSPPPEPPREPIGFSGSAASYFTPPQVDSYVFGESSPAPDVASVFRPLRDKLVSKRNPYDLARPKPPLAPIKSVNTGSGYSTAANIIHRDIASVTSTVSQMLAKSLAGPSGAPPVNPFGVKVNGQGPSPMPQLSPPPVPPPFQNAVQAETWYTKGAGAF